MALLLGPLIALSLSTISVPADGAAQNGPAEASAAEPLDETQQLAQQYDQAMSSRHFDEALKVTDKFHLDSAEGQAIVAAMKVSALLALKRVSEARALIEKADQLAPTSPDPDRIIFFGAVSSGQSDIAADALDRLIARAPDIVRELDWQTLAYFLSDEPKGQDRRNEDRRLELARIGYGGDTAIGHAIATSVVDILVRRGDLSGAKQYLHYVNEPQALENMLIQKRFSALWPELEQLAGPHLQKARESSVRAAENEYNAAPDDHDKLQFYVNALRHAGRLDEAIALRAKVPGSSSDMSSADEQMGWAINYMALALHERGRADEADRLFASLNDAPMPKEYWRVSMKINRLELLVQDGKFEQALPLIEPTARTEGSPYADQLVRRLRYCTLSGLGRKSEAAKYLPDLLKHADDAPAPTIDGLLCAGDLDKAEEVTLAELANPDAKKRLSFEGDFVRQLQAHPLTTDDPSVWHGRWGELRKRPAISAAFDRLGRDLPTDLLPESAH